jgi:hypothetical protein
MADLEIAVQLMGLTLVVDGKIHGLVKEDFHLFL